MRSLSIGLAAALCAFAATSAWSADAVHGKAVFAQCAACHSLDAAKNDTGPNLKGVVGRKAGAVDDYLYSPAMRRSGVTWDEATLDAYLADPQMVVPRTKMPFGGLPDPKDRQDVIAYLKDQP